MLATVGFCLVSGAAFSEPRVGEIAEDETRRIQRRIEARDYSLFAFGPANLQNLAVDQTGQYLMYGHLWETTPHAAVKLAAEGAFSFGEPKASVVAGTLGANFYFTSTSISPFAGVDFGYGAAATEADDIDNVDGWAAGASLGVAFFRTSSVQMQIVGRYLQVFADNEAGQPAHGTLSLGVAF